MAVNKIIEEIDADIKDILSTEFSYTNTTSVPNLDDNTLTFGNAEEKKAKVINTCVLFVDIRGSVALTKKHHTKTMGRLYSAFSKAVLKAAHHHSGYVRNIIGDRVMVVFPSFNCYKNAVHCAITINHLCTKIIDTQFSGMDFKCGIGVDYGELKVIKVGTPKQGKEANENRGLVWTGYPANLASRLTDTANKVVEEDYYVVKQNPYNYAKFWGFGSGLANIFGGIPLSSADLPTYLDKIETVEMSPEKFADSVKTNPTGSVYISGGKFISFEKKTRKTDYPAILISKTVYTGYKKENAGENDITYKYWESQTYKVKDVTDDVYGSNLTWVIK
ncbi:adenylate/guanylate cyclase domain-containing protein [Bizionia saleffrena]|uniref:Adenylate/guanylate cyclase domain-containing protein n=1 Tax=Bizionia saleffrena TaxID=291189 RepID=A0A8H2LL84_9FLAO|nr:adenylate/guanylate cyclase domain-containing protein [Bizionia saleffrena]TYB73025.1 adenylate/guanylate cyclase domain-containing protein [Bizionia saleffrena]